MIADEPRRDERSTRRDPWLALALFLAVFAWPLRASLFDPSVLACGVDTATCQLPWSAPGPSNAELADHGTFSYPMQRFVLESWARGDPPLWNPNIYAGVPAAGNPQVGVFDPQMLALLALERVGGRAASDWGLALLAWLRLAFAAWGAYLLARRVGLRSSGAFVAGLAFGGCGFLTLWLGASLARVAWLLPWLLLAIEHSRGARRARAFAPTACVFALAIYAGHPETSFYCGLCAALWALAIWIEDRAAGARVFVALGLGALFAMPVVLPFLESMGRSGAFVARAAREAQPMDWLALGMLAIVAGVVLRGRELARRFGSSERERQRFATGLAVVLAIAIAACASLVEWPAALRLLLAHDLFGAPGAGELGWFGAGSYLEEASAWIATAAIALALSALLSDGERRLAHRSWIAAIGVSALLLALRAPGLVSIYQQVPVIGLGATVRLAPVAALMLALLAGEAFELAPRSARMAGAGVVALLLGALCVASPSPREFAPLDLAEELDAPDGIVAFTRVPEAVLTSGNASVEGWIDPGLDVRSVAVRVEPLDAATPVAHELPLPAELASRPWSESNVKASSGAHFFRAQFLDARHLAEGRWRFALELRGDGGRLLGTRRFAISEVRRPRVLNRTTIALALLGLACAAFARPRASEWGGWPTALASAAIVAQVFHFQRGAVPAVERSHGFVPTRTTSILAVDLAGARFLSDAGVLPANSGLVYGLRSIDGYDGLDVASFNEFRPYALKPGVHPLLGWNASGVDTSSAAFRLLGVGALVCDAPRELDGFELIAAPRDAPQVAETWIYRALHPLPRAFCVTRVVDVERVRADPRSFDPASSAFLERGVPWMPKQVAATSRVTELESSNREVSMHVSLDGDALLVLLEQHFPGWHVEVDGARRDLLCIDAIFRGVALGPGEHRVVFRYTPTTLVAGAALAVFGLLALAVVSFRARAATRA